MRATLFSLALAAGAGTAMADVVVDLNELTPGPGGYTNNAATASKGVQFNNAYDSDFGSWSGFALSNVNDTTTAGWGNQYASFAGAGGGNYLVAYDGSGYGAMPTITLPAGASPVSLSISNTTYAALSMTHGDSFGKAFGDDRATLGVVETDYPDFFKVTLTGYSGAGGTGDPTGSVDFYLADYRSDTDYILDTWETVDLLPLGAARSITFLFASSDVGRYGINTPTYAAIDDITFVPEPASLALVLLGGAGLLRRRNV